MADSKHNLTRIKRDVEGQIIGGIFTPVKTAVAIFIKKNTNKDYKCAGTILSDTWVITAAHCMTDVEVQDILVVAAEMKLLLYLNGQSKNAVEAGVREVKIHPKCNVILDKLYDWDLALLRLDKSLLIDSNPNIEKALLPPPLIRHSNKEIRVGGWGKTGMIWLIS